MKNWQSLLRSTLEEDVVRLIAIGKVCDVMVRVAAMREAINSD